MAVDEIAATVIRRELNLEPSNERRVGRSAQLGDSPEGRKIGSPQEFDQTRILGRFLEHDEFGPGRSHTLRLQEQVVEVFVAAASSQQ